MATMPDSLPDNAHELNLPLTRSVVYFLTDDERVLYVGQSHCLPGRVYMHGRGDIPFTRVFYIHVRCEDATMVERAWIEALAPPYNALHVPEQEEAQCQSA